MLTIKDFSKGRSVVTIIETGFRIFQVAIKLMSSNVVLLFHVPFDAPPKGIYPIADYSVVSHFEVLDSVSLSLLKTDEGTSVAFR